MKKVTLFTAFLFASVATFAQTWKLDKAHAKVGFTVTHLLVSEVDGNFKTFDATLTSSKPDFSDAVVELTADVNSIDTDNERRDSDLKSDKFFDAAKFPTLTFKSKTFQKVEGKKYKVTGDLTMHGVTKPVTLDVTLNGPIQHPMSKKDVAGFKITGEIKRSDFGIGPNMTTAVVSDEIALRANAEFGKQ
ncbi:YceI family protein [Larkinella terrae]|uniref:Polyisoprenoid-binding protein n=1 Tax=Larkinella terrae TaxID=2025311 RepID=A0A7K0ENG3_9BACT|nr:YceI family protein [Larkinella terrae]MRS63335.1 polyisoprenoid-binding protein [Larkinella terrae]